MESKNIYNLKINSDFPVEIFRENDYEADILIVLNYRTVNMNISSMPQHIKSRIQFVDVYSILIRVSKEENANIATIHMLKDKGIHSTICNFELDYSTETIYIEFKEFCVEFKI